MEQRNDRAELNPVVQNLRPTAQDAARRLIILKYVATRALVLPPRDYLHQCFGESPTEAAEDFTQYAERENEQYWENLRDEGLWERLSPEERRYASRTLVSMAHEEQVQGSWRIESAQTLMWALELLADLPPYDEMADHNLLKRIPAMDVAGFIGSASLRSDAAIHRERDTAEFWHWRSRERQLIEQGETLAENEKLKALGFLSYDDIIRFTARMGASEGIIPPCVEDDFPARGKAYRDLSSQEWFEVSSIAIERHFTLNWLCGYAPGNRWDETPTNT